MTPKAAASTTTAMQGHFRAGSLACRPQRAAAARRRRNPHQQAVFRDKASAGNGFDHKC